MATNQTGFTLETANSFITKHYCEDVSIREVDPEEGVEFKYAVVLMEDGEEVDIVGAGMTVDEAFEEAVETVLGWRV